jgi:hypothetical protein
MAHRSIHGAVWWSIDNKSAIFYFRRFKFSMETVKTGAVNYTVDNTLFTSYVGKDNPYFL